MMKKILMMAFVATSMLLATSCSKDDDQKVFSGDSLKGTTWVANIDESTTETQNGQEMSMSIKGKVSITFTPRPPAPPLSMSPCPPPSWASPSPSL